MAIGDLLVAFEDEVELPLPLDKVKDWILKQGIQDEINFIGVTLDTGVIRGFLHRFRYSPKPYADPVCAAHIYYDKNQAPEWINMVIAKELVHLLDGHKVARKEDFDTLIRRLAMPNELKNLLADPAYALVDKFGDAFAAALLLPFAARRVLLPEYEKTMGAADIARLAMMPTQYVRMVMSPEWEQVYEKMLKAQ